MTVQTQLPIPQGFAPCEAAACQVFRVNYHELFLSARAWADKHKIAPSAKDRKRICLMPIDVQNTFCTPGFELFVEGAPMDNVRLCNFIYTNLQAITEIAPTMDTHTSMQIFHPAFWVNDAGDHPVGNQTLISLDDVVSGKWKVNPAVAHSVAGGNYTGLQRHALHYVRSLSDAGKYSLMVWDFHAMLGGIGHALVSMVEEAIFFHNSCRWSQTGFEIKGGNPLTENYSVLRPEVLLGADGMPVAHKNARFIKRLLEFDAVIIAGQAKSHCVAWTIDDLLNEILAQDPTLAKKVYLMEDCTSPVIVPGVIDFTDMANAAFDRFRAAGMNVVQSTQDLTTWPGLF